MALLLICSFNSCAYDMYDYDYSYYTGEYNSVTIITTGTPIYIDGYISYYFYNGYYWYPYYRGTTIYFHRRPRPMSMYAYRHSRFYHSRQYNNYQHEYYNRGGRPTGRNDFRRPNSSYRDTNPGVSNGNRSTTRTTPSTPTQNVRVRTQVKQQQKTTTPRVTAPRSSSTPRVNTTPRTTPRVNVAPSAASPSTRNSVPSTSRSTGTRRR